MSDEGSSDKTEAPSDKRVHEAMERGQFPKSPEVGVVLMLIAALGAFSLTMSSSARDVGSLAANIFSSLGSIKLQLDTAPMQLAEMAVVMGKVLLPILGACVLAALLGGGLQSGFNLTPQAIGIKLESLDIAAGFKRVFSKDSVIHAGVDFLKMVAIGLALWSAARSLIQDPLFSAPVEVGYLGIYLSRTTNAFLSRLILALGIIAVISYWYEFLKSRRDMMMSRHELKDEAKQAQGDGAVKGAMRRMARRLLQRQMLAQVATADVIITNPTHYAVALRYERGRDQAPVVLAKGENRFAQRIKAVAAEHGVPTIENKPVARMLFALGRVGEVIPSELYQAVAEILAMVYRTHRYYFYRLKTRRVETGTAAKNPSPSSSLQTAPSSPTGQQTLSDAA